MKRYTLIAIAVYGALFSPSIGHLKAADFHVMAGDAAGLITAINQANATPEADVIYLESATYNLTAVDNVDTDPEFPGWVVCRGPDGLPRISSQIRIIGKGPAVTRIQRSPTAPPFRFFLVRGTGDLSLEGVALTGGKLDTYPQVNGAAICNKEGSVKLTNVIVEDNEGPAGIVMNLHATAAMSITNGAVRNNRGGSPSIYNNGNITINNLIVAGNTGGGIGNWNGNLVVANTTIRGNSAYEGAGIVTSGSALVLNSTISSNTAGHGDGGGVINHGGDLTIVGSTISGNKTAVDQQIGGVGAYSGSVNLIYTTIADNDKIQVYAPGGGSGKAIFQGSIISGTPSWVCGYPFNNPPNTVSLGHNFDRDGSCLLADPTDISGVIGYPRDPLLGPLQDNGGPTFTHALLAGSPAIDAGGARGCPASDQRGAIRPKGAACDIGAFESGPEDLTHTARSTVGDRDNFQGGDLIDQPLKSLFVRTMLQNLATQIPGQNLPVNLDVNGFDRSVGWTHLFSLPGGARITSAAVKFRLRGNSRLVSNDELFYEQTSVDTPFLPFISLQDLNGGSFPIEGISLELTLNLAKAPVRTKCPECAAGANLNPLTTTGPNQNGEYRDLIPLLFDGQFDLATGDDATVDWSELTVGYILPGAPIGDLTGDNVVDVNDINVIMKALNTPAYAEDDPRDLDHDGKITVLDARILALCPKTGCVK